MTNLTAKTITSHTTVGNHNGNVRSYTVLDQDGEKIGSIMSLVGAKTWTAVVNYNMPGLYNKGLMQRWPSKTSAAEAVVRHINFHIAHA